MSDRRPPGLGAYVAVSLLGRPIKPGSIHPQIELKIRSEISRLQRERSELAHLKRWSKDPDVIHFAASLDSCLDRLCAALRLRRDEWKQHNHSLMKTRGSR